MVEKILLLKNLGEKIVSIKATHDYTNAGRLLEQVLPKHIPEDDRDAGGIPNLLELSVNCRVILLRNIMTETGLVNGAQGIVRGFEFTESHDIPSLIYVEFDDKSVGCNLQLPSMQNSIAIEPISVEYICQGHSVRRTNFPLQKAFALSIHKLQGASVKNAIMDIGSDIFEPGMGYVALSRVTTLSGLAITELDPHKIYASSLVLAENERLRKLAKQNKKSTPSSED